MLPTSQLLILRGEKRLRREDLLHTGLMRIGHPVVVVVCIILADVEHICKSAIFADANILGPSIYIKRPQRDTSSISSSFKHFQTNPGKSNCSDDDVLSETFTEPIGTLDRNYFSRNKFHFENPLASNNIVNEEKNEDNRPMRKLSNQRSQDAHKDVMDAIKSLDRVLY
ncbi:unnamed protein product [Ceutorhynchus assimilis]|uniref:Uncharacterized protein n=1 Tax=Ceutorhynchus assimilis TaxID=467358 RepID=A0A9N9QNH8_9CUCU|nr:unnamed protein product [Ceutorhynchus assimilis]